ncbi:MAG: peptidoglycan DD-metalloendopeptidase family protein, partial [Gammaproteobacteria bacterium]|nr:peptidoglycan DD-metalloendopeptidase family protein [Gammaproteobacteria bacterium]
VHYQRDDDHFSLSVRERTPEIAVSRTKGVIQNSLYSTGLEAGLSEGVIMELAGIFGWDIDFALDIRKNDTFLVLYEEQYLDGKKINDGPILAAEFTNHNRHFQAIRFVDDHGNSNYFSPDGLSMRKAFLRSPVDFRRISSKFSPERYHPILGKKRPHRGVDYAAATGTPIKAAGDGKVIQLGTMGGYGKTIILQHGGKYTTLYGHMSSYQRKIKQGSRVQQGDVIGYVGKTGMATGPHLHYEFRVNGVHRNPLTVKFPNAAPIDKRYQVAFKQQSQKLLAQLEQLRETQLALLPEG